MIASEIAKRTTDNKHEVMFLVHRQELCEQITDTFSSYGVDMDLCTVNMVQTASVKRKLQEKFEKILIFLANKYIKPTKRTFNMRMTHKYEQRGRCGCTKRKINL